MRNTCEYSEYSIFNLRLALHWTKLSSDNNLHHFVQQESLRPSLALVKISCFRDERAPSPHLRLLPHLLCGRPPQKVLLTKICIIVKKMNKIKSDARTLLPSLSMTSSLVTGAREGVDLLFRDSCQCKNFVVILGTQRHEAVVKLDTC